MQRCKQIIFIILAFLPSMILILTIAQGLLVDQQLSFSNFTFGNVSFVENDSSISISYSSDSITEAVLSSFFDESIQFNRGTALYAFFHGFHLISEAFGFTQIPTVLFIASFYLLYLVFLHFVDLLINFITLIPRLAERFFNI